MTPQRLLSTGIVPALAYLAPLGVPDTPAARRILLAIALQESGIARRRQFGDGPAASFWQFEKGGCHGVLTHPTTRALIARACLDFNVGFSDAEVWEAIRYNDILAAIMARLLILTLPGTLPTTAEQGWTQYTSAWRPGKPRRETWADNWNTATENT